MVITKNKIRKRKFNLIIPNYNNLGFKLILPKNNDYDVIVPNI